MLFGEHGVRFSERTKRPLGDLPRCSKVRGLRPAHSFAGRPGISRGVRIPIVGIKVDVEAMDSEVPDLEDITPQAGMGDAGSPLNPVGRRPVAGTLDNNEVVLDDYIQMRVMMNYRFYYLAEISEKSLYLFLAIRNAPLRKMNAGPLIKEIDQILPAIKSQQILQGYRLALLVGHWPDNKVHRILQSSTRPACLRNRPVMGRREHCTLGRRHPAVSQWLRNSIHGTACSEYSLPWQVQGTA